MAYIDGKGRDICPACLLPVTKHDDRCRYRGLDADEIREVLNR